MAFTKKAVATGALAAALTGCSSSRSPAQRLADALVHADPSVESATVTVKHVDDHSGIEDIRKAKKTPRPIAVTDKKHPAADRAAEDANGRVAQRFFDAGDDTNICRGAESVDANWVLSVKGADGKPLDKGPDGKPLEAIGGGRHRRCR